MATDSSLPQRGRVLDLSLPLAEELPCTWPGHKPYRRVVHSWFDGDSGIAPGATLGDVPPLPRGYYTGWIVIDEHTGTHVDAPVHSLPPRDAGQAAEGAVDGLPLERLVGPARVIDVTALDGEAGNGLSPLVTAETIDRHEHEHGRLDACEIVLLHSGWDRRYVRGDAGRAYSADPRERGLGPGWPAPDVGCIELLLERGVGCLGTDSPSVGPLQDPVATHRAGLAAGLVFVEGLTGLGRLPVSGATFVCMPLKIVGGSGAPARAIALLPEQEPGS